MLGRYGLIIGHFREQSGNCIAMENEEEASKIINQLQTQNDLFDVGDMCHGYAYVLISSPPGVPGETKLKNYLTEDALIPADNIKLVRYPAGGGPIDENEPTPEMNGKLVVKWDSPNNQGGKWVLYDQAETPRWTISYNDKMEKIAGP